MKRQVIDILQDNRLMAIATLRPDGWPQATMIGFFWRQTQDRSLRSRPRSGSEPIRSSTTSSNQRRLARNAE